MRWRAGACARAGSREANARVRASGTRADPEEVDRLPDWHPDIDLVIGRQSRELVANGCEAVLSCGRDPPETGARPIVVAFQRSGLGLVPDLHKSAHDRFVKLERERVELAPAKRVQAHALGLSASYERRDEVGEQLQQGDVRRGECRQLAVRRVQKACDDVVHDHRYADHRNEPFASRLGDAGGVLQAPVVGIVENVHRPRHVRDEPAQTLARAARRATECSCPDVPRRRDGEEPIIVGKRHVRGRGSEQPAAGEDDRVQQSFDVGRFEVEGGNGMIERSRRPRASFAARSDAIVCTSRTRRA